MTQASQTASFGLPADDSSLTWRRSGVVSRRALLARAGALADHLPDAAHVINLYRSREAFLTVFVAALLRGQSNLLPPNQAHGTVAALARRFGAVYVVGEERFDHLGLAQPDPDLAAPLPAELRPVDIDPDHVAAIAFTSGTTGQPRDHPKTWRSLVVGAQLATRRFAFRGTNILATVPPQHMYGLETSIMVPLLCAAGVHDARPLLPEDIAGALGDMPPPRILVTTPIHLRACLEAGVRMPPVALIISATAPLSATLAERAEAAYGVQVREIYGCTEAGSVASRRTLDGDLWSPYDGLRLVHDGEAPVVEGGHVEAPVGLGDVLEADPSGGFRILGRHVDMVSIAGKRGSLEDLTWRLRSIEGIEDGLFVQPETSAGDRAERLAALFVSSSLDERDVLERLRRDIDPAFLPRPIVRVAALPRNELGKLPRTELLRLLRALRRAPGEP